MFSAAFAMLVCGCLCDFEALANWPSMAETLTTNRLGWGERRRRGFRRAQRVAGPTAFTART